MRAGSPSPWFTLCFVFHRSRSSSRPRTTLACAVRWGARHSQVSRTPPSALYTANRTKHRTKYPSSLSILASVRSRSRLHAISIRRVPTAHPPHTHLPSHPLTNHRPLPHPPPVTLSRLLSHRRLVAGPSSLLLCSWRRRCHHLLLHIKRRSGREMRSF